jgi:hypothetical protein
MQLAEHSHFYSGHGWWRIEHLGDPFTIKMVFYNSSNAIVNTAQLSNTLVYGSATPATYTTTTTNCGGSCANVAYVKVEFYGKDGGLLGR